MNETISLTLRSAALIIGCCGAAIILWGVILTLGRFIRCETRRLKHRYSGRESEALRHQFGNYLLLGLELLIAADVLETIVHPTLREIAILGGIVAIRTVISIFLDRELATFHRSGEPES